MLDPCSHETQSFVWHELDLTDATRDRVQKLPRKEDFIASRPIHHRHHLVVFLGNAQQQHMFIVVRYFYVGDDGHAGHCELPQLHISGHVPNIDVGHGLSRCD